MRMVVIVYCLLTVLFAGGCLVALWPWDLWANVAAQALILSVVANVAFAALALVRAPFRVFLVCVVPYVAVQCFVGWLAGYDLEILTFLVVSLVLLKGAVVMLGSWEIHDKAR